MIFLWHNILLLFFSFITNFHTIFIVHSLFVMFANNFLATDPIQMIFIVQ